MIRLHTEQTQQDAKHTKNKRLKTKKIDASMQLPTDRLHSWTRREGNYWRKNGSPEEATASWRPICSAGATCWLQRAVLAFHASWRSCSSTDTSAGSLGSLSSLRPKVPQGSRSTQCPSPDPCPNAQPKQLAIRIGSCDSAIRFRIAEMCEFSNRRFSNSATRDSIRDSKKVSQKQSQDKLKTTPK